MDDRLERNVVIARSGVYYYGKEELERMTNLGRRSMPEEYAGRDEFGVYTPAEVIIEAKDKFTKLPLTREHPPMAIGPDNFKQYAIGWSGDSAKIVPIMESKEIGVESTCVLIDREALVYYECNVRDVSPGYFARYRWEQGTSPDGQEYQIVKYSIDEVNHLAFTQQGRGGPEISMDSMPSLLYYENRLTMDSASAPTFRAMMEDVLENVQTYDEDEIKTGVDAITERIEALPDCDEKAILTRVIKEFYRVKGFTGDAKNAGNYVIDLFEQIDKKIMEDSMGLFSKKPTTDAAPPEPEKKEEAPAAEAPAPTEPPADVPGEPVKDEVAGPGVAPTGPEAEPTAEAPAGPGEVAPAAAPIAQVAMEVSAMPDDVSTLSDDELRAFLNGVVKFLKTIAPGEAQEPVHQESPAPVTDSVTPEGEGIPPMGDSEPDDGITTDSVFSVFGRPVGDSTLGESSLAELTQKMFSKKGAK